MATTLVERNADRVLGVLFCYDRVIVRGGVRGFHYAKAMEGYLRAHEIRLFDFPKWAKPYRDAVRDNAERLARAAGIEVQFIRDHKQRKEDIVARILEKRGEDPGLVAILSALETCESYEARYDKKTGRTSLRPDRAKCIHYYFYFIDEQLGLCFMRVSTWCPFPAQAYVNGHNLLAAKLRRAGIGYRMLDNAFTHIDDTATGRTVMTSGLKLKTLALIPRACAATSFGPCSVDTIEPGREQKVP